MEYIDWQIEKWEKKYSYVELTQKEYRVTDNEYLQLVFQKENILDFIKDLKNINVEINRERQRSERIKP